MTFNRRGEAVTAVLLVIVILGGVALIWKPKFLHGETKRAEASAKATQELQAAYNKVSSVVAADVEQISQVAATLPPSFEKEFIVAETTLVKSRLPAPDPDELLKSAERKIAVLEGNFALSQKLYKQASAKTIELGNVLAKEKFERAEVDLELQTVAAAHRAEERQKNIALILLGIAALGWLYTRWTRLSPGALAVAVNDMHKGVPGIQALDGVTSRTEQYFVRLMAAIKAR